MSLPSDLMTQWDFDKNDLSPQFLTPYSGKMAWWNCIDHDHSYKTSIAKKSQGRGCPYCSGRAVLGGFNDAASRRPELVSIWDKNLNSVTLEDVTEFSHKKMHWLCPKNHSYISSVAHASRGVGCPYCTRKRILAGFNDLESQFPKLAAELSPTNTISARQVTDGSHTNLFWLCINRHEWRASVKTRVAGHACPYCSGVKVLVGFNDLQTTQPPFLTEWDYDKNGIKPTEIQAGSHIKVWWLCAKNHSWEARVYSRHNRGCPHCALAGTSKVEQELFELISQKYTSFHRVKLRPVAAKRRFEVDILSETGRMNLVIEYDGSYFHKDCFERDAEKTIDLLSAQYLVVRVRESNNTILGFLDIEHPNLLQIEYRFGASLKDEVWSKIENWIETKENHA